VNIYNLVGIASSIVFLSYQLIGCGYVINDYNILNNFKL